MLATVLDRWAEAAQHFEDALAMNTTMGARTWLVHTQHDYARMLIARDDDGARERARELLNQAHATYHELGMDIHAASTSQPIHREVMDRPPSTPLPS